MYIINRCIYTVHIHVHESQTEHYMDIWIFVHSYTLPTCDASASRNSGVLPNSFALAFGFGAAMCVMAMVAWLLLGGLEDSNMPWPQGLVDSLIVGKNHH